MPTPSSTRLPVGIEVASADLIGLLQPGSADLLAALDASPATYLLIGTDRGVPGLRDAPSPTIVGTVLAQRTQRIGLVVAASPQRDHPYNLARRVASLDHLSRGRAGVVGLLRDHALDLGLGQASTWTDHRWGPDALADAITALRKLWRTWPRETLDADPQAALAAELRFANHVGIFSSRGPLNSPSTLQGEPVVFWRWDAADATADQYEAARTADVVVVDDTHVQDFFALTQGASAGYPDTPRQNRTQVHVRVSTWDSAAIARHRADARVTGLVLVAQPGELTERVRALSTWTAVEGGTLRERLAVDRRIEPDISQQPLVFPVRTKEAA